MALLSGSVSDQQVSRQRGAPFSSHKAGAARRRAQRLSGGWGQSTETAQKGPSCEGPETSPRGTGNAFLGASGRTQLGRSWGASSAAGNTPTRTQVRGGRARPAPPSPPSSAGTADAGSLANFLLCAAQLPLGGKTTPTLPVASWSSSPLFPVTAVVGASASASPSSCLILVLASRRCTSCCRADGSGASARRQRGRRGCSAGAGAALSPGRGALPSAQQ